MACLGLVVSCWWDDIGWENLMWEGFMGFIVEERNKFLNLVLERDGSIKRDYE